MVTTYMLTIPIYQKIEWMKEEEKNEWKIKWPPLEFERHVSKRELRIMLEKNDCKKWIIGMEEGKNGYKHYQIRLSTSNKGFFYWASTHITGLHIEEAGTDSFEYERKEGKFWTSDDNNEIRKVRFGKLKENQITIMEKVETQNDREVDVFLDPTGNHGKSWLTIHLWETGKALVVPRASATAEKLSAFVCSAYKGEPYIIIDIPRAQKPTVGLYEAIEELKDGLVFDHRYSGKTRNVRGAKIIIFTNTPLDLKKLSHDRWRVHNVRGGNPPTASPPTKEDKGEGMPIS